MIVTKFELLLASIALLFKSTHGFATFTARKSVVAKSTRLDAKFGSLGAEILGVGSAVPDTIITNVDMESLVETSDEWIRTRTGIEQRRVLLHPEDGVNEGELCTKTSLSSLATVAAKNALASAGKEASDIDLVICCTSSPEDMFGDATTIAFNLGIRDAMCFDLTAACSGFLFGIVTASNYLHLSDMNALVIGADALSRHVDWSDRNSCILFGDGAGAMVLTSSDDSTDSGILSYATHSDGEGHSKLLASYKGEENAVNAGSEPVVLSKSSYNCIGMDGKEVYKFATREVPRVISEALEVANLTSDDVSWLCLHQANTRILDVVAKRLSIPNEKLLTNLAGVGNTSAASIPLCLSDNIDKIKKGDIVVMAGFGAGLSWGASVVRW